MQIFLTGATGFVGQHMLKRLLDESHSVRALVHIGPNQARLLALPSSKDASELAKRISVAAGDVVSGEGLDAGMQGCDAVVQLVGIIVEKGKNTFDAVHQLGTRNVVEAAKRRGIKRFIHMSALGVRADGVAAYQTSKW